MRHLFLVRKTTELPPIQLVGDLLTTVSKPDISTLLRIGHFYFALTGGASGLDFGIDLGYTISSYIFYSLYNFSRGDGETGKDT
jgi:hypothetical protein